MGSYARIGRFVRAPAHSLAAAPSRFRRACSAIMVALLVAASPAKQPLSAASDEPAISGRDLNFPIAGRDHQTLARNANGVAVEHWWLFPALLAATDSGDADTVGGMLPTTRLVRASSEPRRGVNVPAGLKSRPYNAQAPPFVAIV